MRLIAFLFLAAFALAGIVRYSKAAAPVPGPVPVAAMVPAEGVKPLMATGVAQPLIPVASQVSAQPAPHVLRHKRRFAKAALRAIRKAEALEPARPQRQAAQRQMAQGQIAKARSARR